MYFVGPIKFQFISNVYFCLKNLFSSEFPAFYKFHLSSFIKWLRILLNWIRSVYIALACITPSFSRKYSIENFRLIYLVLHSRDVSTHLTHSIHRTHLTHSACTLVYRRRIKLVRVECVRCPWAFLRNEVSTIFGIIFLFLSFFATYFSPRRGCPRVMTFCKDL